MARGSLTACVRKENRAVGGDQRRIPQRRFLRALPRKRPARTRPGDSTKIIARDRRRAVTAWAVIDLPYNRLITTALMSSVGAAYSSALFLISSKIRRALS